MLFCPCERTCQLALSPAHILPLTDHIPYTTNTHTVYASTHAVPVCEYTNARARTGEKNSTPARSAQRCIYKPTPQMRAHSEPKHVRTCARTCTRTQKRGAQNSTRECKHERRPLMSRSHVQAQWLPPFLSLPRAALRPARIAKSESCGHFPSVGCDYSSCGQSLSESCGVVARFVVIRVGGPAGDSSPPPDGEQGGRRLARSRGACDSGSQGSGCAGGDALPDSEPP